MCGVGAVGRGMAEPQRLMPLLPECGRGCSTDVCVLGVQPASVVPPFPERVAACERHTRRVCSPCTGWVRSAVCPSATRRSLEDSPAVAMGRSAELRRACRDLAAGVFLCDFANFLCAMRGSFASAQVCVAPGDGGVCVYVCLWSVHTTTT